ncbi:MAG: hypothetical protein D6782_12295 [Alphaproteobacteria bacterium]|nr:MAG: hypothetical protein D6782_12295 [Alphaproteobacteria bacterium]
MGQIDIALALDSLFGNPLVIDRLALVEPTLLFEAGKGGSNLTALQRNIAAFAKRTGSTPAAAPARDVVIHELLINGARLTLSGLPGVAPQAIALADIRLRDIGVREGGVPASEAARLAMDAIMPQVMQALASREGKKLLGKVTKGLVGDETPAPPGDKSLGKELEKGLNKLFQGND